MNNAQAQQFAALQKATATYQNETKTADHMRRREVDLLNRAQEQLRHLEEELRAAHGAVGEEARGRSNLETERRRYAQAMEADRQANVRITSELRGIEADSKEQRTQFVKEMESLNDESDFLLARREDGKTSRLLDAGEVRWIVETRFGCLARIEGGGDGEARGEGGGPSRWDEVASRTTEELAGLVEGDGRRESAASEIDQLEQILQQIRLKFSAENSIGQLEIDDLEAKWGQQYEYGDFLDEDQGEGETMDEDGRDCSSNARLAATAALGASAPHMELFYHQEDHQGYGGPVHDATAANTVGHSC